ncbi:hypothetical protein IT087_03180 [Candidatus Uhrbacteria bacterium]|nr:hypothetical protein [Candidatus Uhrbacteria bacterium]
MKNLISKPFFVGAAVVIALAAITSVAPVSADLDVWSWADKSAGLPQRDGIRFTTMANRQGAWLLSDGASLLRFDSDKVSDLTQEARDRGLRSIKLIASDNRSWMIWSKNADESRGQLWLRDDSTWTDLTNVLPPSVETLDVTGSAGSWILRSVSHGTSRSIYLSNANAIPADLTLPIDASSLAAGCIKENSGSTLCTGVNRAMNAGGMWFWMGGATEARSANGTTPGRTSIKLWRLSGTEFISMKNVPAAKFVSGVWQTQAGILVATSESPMNPLLADRLWLFNGYSWRELSGQAKALGLLPADASNIKVAYGGTSWMIASGNKLYRYDGSSLRSKGEARVKVSAISGGNGFALTGVDANDFASLFAIGDNVADETKDTTPTANAAAIASMLAGTDLRVDGIPSDAVIGDGRGFTFRASAEDIAGIDRIEVFVNGARIRICPGNACEFTQTYWAMRQPERKVIFQAKAWNKLGVATDSRIITLVVKQNSTAGLNPVSTGSASVGLSQDFGTGMAYATWTDPAGTDLPAGNTVTYFVSGQDKLDGLASIEIWVNGAVVKTCAAGQTKDEFRCETTLSAADYPTGTDLFMNARLADTKGNSLWVPATTLSRSAPPIISATAITNETTEAQPIITGVSPVFASRLSIEPAAKDIRRGTTLTIRAKSQNNLVGLERVEISYGGQIRNICRFGVAMSETTCELTIDTSTLADNTSLSFMARAIDAEGRETWSNSESVTVHGATWTPAPAAAAADAKGFSQWSWLSPELAGLENNQEATYTVGSWSPEGVKSIEITANGTVRKTCGFISGTASRECAYVLRPSDWSHGDVVTVNARITDFSGNVIWSAAKSLLMTRGWWEPVNQPSAYVNVTASRTDGYKSGDSLTFTLLGWSPNGADRLELLVDGKVAASCPSDVCRWTSPALTSDRLEFQARLTDRSGKQVWSGLYGLKKQ